MAPSTVVILNAPNALALTRPAGSGAIYTPPSSFQGPGGIAVEQPQTAPLLLSLDDAISIGLARNLRIKYDVANQRVVKGYQLQIANALLPSLKVYAATGTQEINLAAMGFKPAAISAVLQQSGQTGAVPTIVKVDTTQAILSTNQELFDLPAYELLRAAQREFAVEDFDRLNSRGELVQAVGTAYFKLLADQSTVSNAQAEERAAKTLFDQATQRQQNGVGTHLDSLRAQVEYQQRTQATVSALAQLGKDTIQLNRIMGIPAGQALELTDTAPFAVFADMDHAAALRTAYLRRKDLLSLQAQIDVADRELRAAKYQRLPTLAFNGFYGVLGETEGLYHGVFRAAGEVRFPIFREAAQRGQEEQVGAQLTALRQEEASLRVTIDSQIRAAMLDVQAAADLVNVAQSNVELSQQELSDETERFNAGIDTNLPVVDAQASLTGAHAQLVQALYQYNVAKLALARNTGVIESSYRAYLGK